MKCFNDYVVDVNNLKNNAQTIKSYIGNSCKLCAVVKADAYGLGLEVICKSLNGLVDFFAVACLKEALKIRVFNKYTPILILSCVDKEDYNIVAEQNISISVGDIDTIENLVNYSGKQINIHLQVNTGLNRFGFRTIKDFVRAMNIINNNQNLHLEGVYSHFATKKNDISFINKQYLRFLQFKRKVNNTQVICHIANSYAVLDKKYHLDMVRCGYLLYGLNKCEISTKPVLSIHARIISIAKVKKGDTIGYDRTFKAIKPMKIGVVSVGYADGYNRLLSNKGHVVINGKKLAVVGMICMDVFMVDITNTNVQVGDKVTLISNDLESGVSIVNLAQIINVSPYEFMCNWNHKRMNYIIKQ